MDKEKTEQYSDERYYQRVLERHRQWKKGGEPAIAVILTAIICLAGLYLVAELATLWLSKSYYLRDRDAAMFGIVLFFAVYLGTFLDLYTAADRDPSRVEQAQNLHVVGSCLAFLAAAGLIVYAIRF